MGILSHMQGVSGHIEKHYEAMRTNDKPSRKKISCKNCAQFDKEDGSCSRYNINYMDNLAEKAKSCPQYDPW